MAILSGCTTTTDDQWQDYLMRLENVFGIAIDKQNRPPNKPFGLPRRRERQIQLDYPKINLWEFLKLYQCEVNTLIAKRNSPMGKVMPPSQQLLYALEFIPKAKKCIRQQDISQKGREALRLAIEFYESNAPRLLMNAIFHEEWEKAFHGHAIWPLDQTYPSAGLPPLDRFMTIKLDLNKPAIPNSALLQSFEQDLKQLADSRYPGNWLRHLSEASHYLTVSNVALSQAKTLCPLGRGNRKSEIMQNVFVKYFNGQVQPWISQLHRFGQSFEPQLATLAQGSASMERFHHKLFSAPTGPWLLFQQAWRQHVHLWQQHLGSCQLMPKRPLNS